MSSINIRFVSTDDDKLVLQEQGNGRRWHDVAVISQQQEEAEFKESHNTFTREFIVDKIKKYKAHNTEYHNHRQIRNHLKWLREVLQKHDER